MNIDLDEFIKTHRKEFDTDEPSGRLWDSIELELNREHKTTPKKRKWYWGLSLAASLILVTGILFLSVRTGKKMRPNLAEINPRAAEKQMHFVNVIAEKRDSLANYAADNPELYAQFEHDLQTLNHNYEKLRKELPGSPNQQLIVKAMMRNLEIQMQLLSQQIAIISSVNAYNKKNQI